MPITNSSPTSYSQGPQSGSVLIIDTSAAPYTTTNATAVVTGSDLDLTLFRSLSLTVKNTGVSNTITYSVWGANLSDFSDEVIVQAAADVLQSAVGTYTVYPAVYRFYRVKAIDKVGGSHSTVVVAGIGKG